MASRTITITVLVALVLLFGAIFYQVMAGFVMPVFLAVLMTVLFVPLYERLLPYCRNQSWGASLVTVLIVMFLILAPTVWLGLRGAAEARGYLNEHGGLSFDMSFVDRGVAWLNERFQLALKAEKIRTDLIGWSGKFITEIAVNIPGKIFEYLFGLVIMLLSMYYFLTDGRSMLVTIGKLLPLEQSHQHRLAAEFSTVCRAVAAATLLSALGQGILAGIGYWLAGIPSLALLTFLTILAGLVPFIGAAAIWIPCCAWLWIAQPDGHWRAIFLAVYGVAVVSMVDNLIKPYVLQGQTNLHPLPALLSVLGGVTAVGPIGIFVGPMAVVFLQAALTMLKNELEAVPRAKA